MWKTKNSQVEEKGDRSEQRNWPLLNPRGALVSKAPIKSAPSTSGLSGGLHTATKDSVLFSKSCAFCIFKSRKLPRPPESRANDYYWKTHQACMPFLNVFSWEITNWFCFISCKCRPVVLISAGGQIKPSVQQSPIKAFFFFLPPFYRQISSTWQNSLCHTPASLKTHGMMCLWRCPVRRRICFLWRPRYVTVSHQVFARLGETRQEIFSLPFVSVEANCRFVLFCRMEAASKVGGILSKLPWGQDSRVHWTSG